ncbi:MAG: SDR family NAD(P)-dependent oxidoreductase [Thermoleophilia bacterium]
MSIDRRLSLAGRIALVTGAAAGIGRATAQTLASRGAAAVWLVDLAADGLDEVCVEVSRYGAVARPLVQDVADYAGVERALRGQRVDLLVNAAGNVASSPFAELGLREWQATLDSHLKGAFVTTRVLAPGMVERRYGRIVNVASVAGKRGGGFLGKTAYAAAKAGVNGLTKATARELAPHGIRVNAVNPGLTDTARLDLLRADPDVWARCLAAVPLGREAAPAEIAAAILWLLSDAAAYVTGETLNVDGGIAME